MLRRLRRERGLTQDQLAEACGIHVNHVSFLERELRGPSLYVIFQLAGVLGLDAPGLVAEIDFEIRRGATQ